MKVLLTDNNGDLIINSKKEFIESSEYKFNRAKVEADHKYSVKKPREVNIWVKSKVEKDIVKRAKNKWRYFMKSKYKDFTRKADFYTQKALIWY